jgi:hypothetical protein
VTLFFGDRWDAPQVDDATQVNTPVGRQCLYCAEPVEQDDRGLLRYYSLGTPPAPVHMECDLRMSLGSVAHLEGRCSCNCQYAATSSKTFREQARETLAWINRMRGRPL